MSNVTRINCPELYVNDAYVRQVCAALYSAVSQAWIDAEIFKQQLFAKTVNSDGYKLWAEYLGLPGTQSLLVSATTLTDKLQAESNFTAEAISKDVRKICGNVMYTTIEWPNKLALIFPNDIDATKLKNVSARLRDIKPMHLDLKIRTVATAGSVSFKLSESGILQMIVSSDYVGRFDPASMADVRFGLNASNGNLTMTTPADYGGATFTINNNGNLEVTY